MEPDDAWGANAELRTDSRQLLGSRYSAPLSVSGSVMGHKGERMAAVSAAMQVRWWGCRDTVGGCGWGVCVCAESSLCCLQISCKRTTHSI